MNSDNYETVYGTGKDSDDDSYEETEYESNNNDDPDYNPFSKSKQRKLLYKNIDYELYYEFSLSDRAVCKICNKKINKDTPKMGFIHPVYRSSLSNHFDCFINECGFLFRKINKNKIAYGDEPDADDYDYIEKNFK